MLVKKNDCNSLRKKTEFVFAKLANWSFHISFSKENTLYKNSEGYSGNFLFTNISLDICTSTIYSEQYIIEVTNKEEFRNILSLTTK